MRETQLAFAAALLLAGPAMGQTACPVADDLFRGIRVDFDGGRVETYRSAGQGVVLMEGREADGPGYRLNLGQGTHVLRYETPGDVSSVQVYDYGVGPAEMPVPVPGGRWQVEVSVTAPGRDRIEAQAQAYDQETTRQIGACSYRVVPVVIAYDTADAYMEGLDYLPELGFAYLVWSRNADGPGAEYSPVAISAGK